MVDTVTREVVNRVEYQSLCVDAEVEEAVAGAAVAVVVALFEKFLALLRL